MFDVFVKTEDQSFYVFLGTEDLIIANGILKEDRTYCFKTKVRIDKYLIVILICTN